MSNVASEQRTYRAAVKEFVTAKQTWFGNKAISDAVKQNLASLARKCKSLTFNTFRSSVDHIDSVHIDAVGGAIHILWRGACHGGDIEISVWSGRERVKSKKWKMEEIPSQADTDRVVALMFKILGNQIENAIFCDQLDRIL